MTRAWLTKNSIPSTRVDYVISLPDSEAWRADFLGSLLLLAQEQNWEEFEALSSQEMADEWMSVLLEFEEFGQLMIPVGTIMAFAGSIAPSGFFLCDFSEFNRADFSNLFDVIGERYGVGNGTTTANLPDLRGRVIVGFDGTDEDFNDLENFGGQKMVILSIDEMPTFTVVQNSHNHTQDSHNHTQNAHVHGIFAQNFSGSGTLSRTPTANTGANDVTSGVTTAVNQAATATNQAATATNQPVGDDQAHNNLQPYWVMNYIIKY